jgi:hypothetical protein
MKMSKRRKPIEIDMTREEVMDTWIWLPRLQLTASLLFGKKWTKCTEDQQYEVRKYVLENYEV